MVYLGSATRKVLLGAAQYFLSNAYWATVYVHSTTIKERLRAVHYLLPNTYWVMVHLGSATRKSAVGCSAANVTKYLLGQDLPVRQLKSCFVHCAVHYLLPYAYWVMVYLSSSPIKELLCALCSSLLLPNTYWVMVY
jgi:hypothetical protein